MALKGLDVFKLSPKTNCGKCGFPTCMAFCMEVAGGRKTPEDCPYFSPEGKEKLQSLMTPPMHTVTVGGRAFGGETVLFRHEKTFVNPNAFAVKIHTDMDTATARACLEAMRKTDYTRIGQRMYPEFICVENRQSDPTVYASLVSLAQDFDRSLLLLCRDVPCAEAAIALCDDNAVLDGATAENYEEMNRLVSGKKIPLGVWGQTVSELYDTVKALESAGNENLMLDVTGETAKQTFAACVLARRSAIADGVRSLGYPVIADIAALSGGDRDLETAYATAFTVRCGSVLILSDMAYDRALPLFGLRQNLYTDPRKPMKVESKIYPINGADENDPCAVTVDFALTYFLVSGELERSGKRVNLIISDAGGMSVLTAWAAGKLSAASIKKTWDDLRVNEKIRSRILMIPGKVAGLRDEIQEALPEWTVVATPGEAAQLPKYMRDETYREDARTVQRVTGSQTVQSEDSLSFETLLTMLPPIEKADTGVTYSPRDPDSGRFTVIGERIHCIAPDVRDAMERRDPAPILRRAAEQIAAGATYLDVNIGPAARDGAQRMMWAVKLLQENFDGVPLALDTANKRAIEAGISVYDRRNGKPIINSADAGSRIDYIDLAAHNDAIVIALCSADGVAQDNAERLAHCQTMLDRGLRLGMAAEDMWFDPGFLVVKGMQDKQLEILDAIGLLSEQGLRTTGGLSNNSNGIPKQLRPELDSVLLSMCIARGLTSAIINPCNGQMMRVARICDMYRNRILYSDSFLDIR